MQSLSNDLVAKIFDHLDERDLAMASRVCKSWKSEAMRKRGTRPEIPFVVNDFLDREEKVVWAIKNGCPLTARMFSKAASKGVVSVLRALVENRCPHDSRACMEASKHGHLRALMWMRKRGFGWNMLTCAVASETYDEKARRVLRWLNTVSCPCKNTYH
jgi:hypothetical protein